MFFLLIIVLAFVLRFLGIHYGLPGLFNADEPHVVDIAMSFGAGTLNPHYFKYPTLYMYLLFVCYGFFFVIGSGFGFFHSLRQYGGLFVWHPTPFYLIARCLSALFSLAAIYPVSKAAALLAGKDRGALWSAILLAASPVLVESAHAAKPESLMFFLAGWSWYFAVLYRLQGNPQELVKCGFAMGLACASQYTAIPALSLIAAAWYSSHRRIRLLLGSAFAASIGFFAGAPFIVLDPAAFFAAMRDMHAMNGMISGWFPVSMRPVSWNLLHFSGSFWLGGVALIAGIVYSILRDRKTAGLLLTPPLVLAACLSFSGEGGWARYLFAGFPALAILAGLGAEWAVGGLESYAGKIPRGIPALSAVVVVLLGAPGAWLAWRFDRQLLLPDTRLLAAGWIEKNVPQGSKILIDQEHASPPLRLDLAAVKELFRKTTALRHPRAKYYEIMRDSHPGGGYTVYQVLRSADDLHTLPGYAAESSLGRPYLDVRPGLSVAVRKGIEWVALSSFGATKERSPELAGFLTETEQKGRLEAEFAPKEGVTTGPLIRIYRIHA